MDFDWTLSATLFDGGTRTPPNLVQILTYFIPVINTLLFLIAPIILVAMFVFGGYKRLMAADNPKAVQESNQTIFWAVIGIVVVFLSYLIVQLVASLIGINLNDYPVTL